MNYHYVNMTHIPTLAVKQLYEVIVHLHRKEWFRQLSEKLFHNSSHHVNLRLRC